MALAFDKVRFLIVEDHEPSIQIVRTLLKSLGVKDVVAVHTPADALWRLDNEKFDIVVLDLLLGEETGLDLLRNMRREESRHAFLPVLVLSAYTEKSRVEAARDAGASEICAKPVAPAEMYRKLVSMIVEPRMFVRTGGYFGPDRRRRKADESYRGPERRERPPEDDAANAKADEDG